MNLNMYCRLNMIYIYDIQYYMKLYELLDFYSITNYEMYCRLKYGHMKS
jgi:hypothetical protein